MTEAAAGPARPAAVCPPAADLLPGERLVRDGACQALAYTAAGAPGQPLVLFLPGGGHLARVAYGNPAAAPRDFLAHWIAAAGHPLLALSYPSDHPVFAGDFRTLTTGQWAAVVARTARAVIDEGSLPDEIIVLAWSMAGRTAVALNRALHAIGLRLRCFVSLAATAPVPGLAGGGKEILTRTGLWDPAALGTGRNSRAVIWQQELLRQACLEERQIMPWADYQRWNLCNTPLNLRGEGNRMTPSGPEHDLGETIEDLGSLAFGAYPPLAAITPTSRHDAHHALTDSAAWMFLAVQRVAAMTASGRGAASLTDTEWSRLRRITAAMPGRLTRTIDGGHLFFLGAAGARQTVRHALALATAAAAIDTEVRELLSQQAESARAESARGVREQPSQHAE